jgi:zinc protease
MAALDKAVAEFIGEGVDMDQFARIKMQIKADLIYQRDDVQAMANDYGAALTSGLTLADVKAWPQVLQDVTPEEVIEAAKLLQDKRQAVTSWLTNPAAQEMTKAEVTQ